VRGSTILALSVGYASRNASAGCTRTASSAGRRARATPPTTMTAQTIATSSTGTTATGTAPSGKRTSARSPLRRDSRGYANHEADGDDRERLPARGREDLSPDETKDLEQRHLPSTSRDAYEEQMREGRRSKEGQGDAEQEGKVHGLAEVDQVDRHVQYIDVLGELSLESSERIAPGQAGRDAHRHAPPRD